MKKLQIAPLLILVVPLLALPGTVAAEGIDKLSGVKAQLLDDKTNHDVQASPISASRAGHASI